MCDLLMPPTLSPPVPLRNLHVGTRCVETQSDLPVLSPSPANKKHEQMDECIDSYDQVAAAVLSSDMASERPQRTTSWKGRSTSRWPSQSPEFLPIQYVLFSVEVHALAYRSMPWPIDPCLGSLERPCRCNTHFMERCPAHSPAWGGAGTPSQHLTATNNRLCPVVSTSPADLLIAPCILHVQPRAHATRASAGHSALLAAGRCSVTVICVKKLLFA